MADGIVRGASAKFGNASLQTQIYSEIIPTPDDFDPKDIWSCGFKPNMF